MAQPVTNESILKAVNAMKGDLMAHIDAKMDSITNSVAALTDSVNSLGIKVNELETRVGTNQDNFTNLEARVKALEKQNILLAERADDAENRSRALNLRLLRVPENSEGQDIIGFVGQLLVQLFGQSNFPSPPVIQNAHRTPSGFGRGNNPNAGPRPILVKLMYFQDKLKLLRLAREKKELAYRGSRLHIYPDFSAGVMAKRRLFVPVKNRLRELGFQYSLLYPATLRVKVDEDVTLLFRSPEEADGFIREKKMTLP